jgi:hypothetical protein
VTFLREVGSRNECSDRRSAQFRQGRFHFRASVIVSGAAGTGDAGAQGGASFLRTTCLGEELSVLEVGCDVIGMRGEKRLELQVGATGIA